MKRDAHALTYALADFSAVDQQLLLAAWSAHLGWAHVIEHKGAPMIVGVTDDTGPLDPQDTGKPERGSLEYIDDIRGMPRRWAARA